MARLLVKTAGLENQVIELKLGTNRLGRGPDNDFTISHPTISSVHCELFLSERGVVLRDLESTNGTFLNGEPVREIKVQIGQTVRLGDVELFVETTDANVAIPQFSNPEIPAPPVVKESGVMVCPRHAEAPVTHQCTHCREVMCDACVHRLRRKGSKNLLMLCPICSSPVELIGAPKQRKKSFFARVGETVKMKLTRSIRVDR